MADAHAHLFVLGINHLTASVELRDRLQLGKDEVKTFAASALDTGEVAELVLLSTCNRSELYGLTPEPAVARAALETRWSALRGVEAGEIRSHGYFFTRDEAVRHLFRVMGSLDSLVLGEVQIFGQVKEAYHLAQQNRWVGFYLNHVFQAGLHAGKRIHAETAIHEGAVSISYAAVELARKVLGNLPGKTAAVVGTGEMGELAAHHLHKAGVRKFLFFNRSRGSAERLAAFLGGEVRLLEELATHLAHCDIVVAATGSPDLVITRDHALTASRHRQGRPLFLIDIAAPRDIDPAVGEIDNTFLFTIDDLKSVISENADLRRQAAQQAEAIVAEEAAHIESWSQGLEVVPVLRSLRAKFCALAEKEIEKWAAGQPPELRRQFEALGHGLVNKMLHPPSVGLKALGAQGDAQRASYYAAALFGLGDNPGGDDHG